MNPSVSSPSGKHRHWPSSSSPESPPPSGATVYDASGPSAASFGPVASSPHGLPAPGKVVASPAVRLEGSRQRALDALAAAARSHEAAAGAGVQVARASFLTRWASLAISSASFALAVAATVATAGAAAPVLAVASYYLLQAAGDAWCATRCWQDEQQRQLDPSHQMSLPMGASAVGNLLYFAAEGLGCKPEQAQAVARRGAALATALAGVLGVFAGSTAPVVAADLVVTRLACSSVQALIQPFETFFPIVRKLSLDTASRIAQAKAEKAVCDYLSLCLEKTGQYPAFMAQVLELELPSLLDELPAGDGPRWPHERERLDALLSELVSRGQHAAQGALGIEERGPKGPCYAILQVEPKSADAAAIEAEALRMGSRGIIMAGALRSVALSAMTLRG